MPFYSVFYVSVIMSNSDVLGFNCNLYVDVCMRLLQLFMFNASDC